MTAIYTIFFYYFNESKISRIVIVTNKFLEVIYVQGRIRCGIDYVFFSRFFLFASHFSCRLASPCVHPWFYSFTI